MGQEAFHYVCLRVAPRTTQYKHTSLPLKEDLLPCVCVCVCVCARVLNPMSLATPSQPRVLIPTSNKNMADARNCEEGAKIPPL